MDITHDAEVDAAYITLGRPIGPGEAARQIHSIRAPGGAGEIILDFDADGRLLGIEVLGAAAVLRPELLAGARPPDG